MDCSRLVLRPTRQRGLANDSTGNKNMDESRVGNGVAFKRARQMHIQRRLTEGGDNNSCTPFRLDINKTKKPSSASYPCTLEQIRQDEGGCQYSV